MLEEFKCARLNIIFLKLILRAKLLFIRWRLDYLLIQYSNLPTSVFCVETLLNSRLNLLYFIIDKW